jgi:hemerythrin-like domain-containing protein
MKSTKALMADHEIIMRALDVLDAMTAQMKHGEDVSRTDIDSLLVFLREFAEGCHHVKEEAIFLPALMQAGMGLHDGPIQVMTYEHQRERALTAAMLESIEGNKKEDFVLYAARYVKLLTEHIEKENDILFDRADLILSDDDDDRIVAAFEHFEKTTVGVQAHARLLSRIDGLAAKYLGSAVSAR